MCLSVTCIFSLVKCLDPLTILNKSSSNNSNMWIILTGWIHSTLSNSGLPPGHFLILFHGDSGFYHKSSREQFYFSKTIPSGSY